MRARTFLAIVATLFVVANASAQIQVSVVDMIPNSMSNDITRDSEPNVTVDPANPQRIAASAFTPDPMLSGIAPIFLSVDGGTTWDIRTMLPGGNKTGDTSIRFGGLSGVLYGGILRTDNSNLNILRKADYTVAGAAEILSSRANNDQPWMEATSLYRGAAPDRMYMGSNDGLVNADIDQSLDVATGLPPAGLSTVAVDGTALCRDAPSVRPAIHGSGRIYVAYLRWNSCAGMFPTGDVIVVRDDNWASAAPRYQALMTGMSPGVAVASGRTFPFFGNLGTQRVGSALAVAVDPTNRDVVYVAWGEGASGPAQQIILRRSTDGGSTWSADLRTVASATNPALAVNSQGVVGFLYQKNSGGMNAHWETHFEYSDSGFTTPPTDLMLANVPDQNGTYLAANPIGDYANLVSVGKNFYGVFCGNNTADPANFPLGITYLRNVNLMTKKIRNLANTMDVAESIDPFFFRVRMIPPEKDFYVRDWNDGVTGDDGSEPSTHPVFYQTGDVWNRRGTLPGVFGDNDPPPNENAGNGAGAIGDNWSFTRIRRNAPAAMGSTNVTAHFLVSEFGTGSAYSDNTTANPNLTFDPDTVVNFAAASVGPTITTASHWTLASIMSTHLCLGVQISTPDDPYVPPSLANQWPGWSSGTDLRILADNNKAQKNMGLSVTPARGVGMGDDYFAIVHNAAPFRRDMELSFEIDPTVAKKLSPILTIAGESSRQIVRNGSVILHDMQPGENRWVDVQFDAANVEWHETLPIHFYERFSGAPVNGFTIAARGGSLEESIHEKLTLHRSVFTRLGAIGVKEADDEAKYADFLLTRTDLSTFEYMAAMQRDSLRQLLSLLPQLPAVQKLIRPFRVDQALQVFFATVDQKDATQLVLAHSVLLNRIDAALTRARLDEGDPADIVTTIAWQRDIYRGSARLAKLRCSDGVANAAEEYVNAIGAGKITNEQYPGFLRSSSDCFAETVGALGSESLRTALEAIRNAPADLAGQQNAHRLFLLALSSSLN